MMIKSGDIFIQHKPVFDNILIGWAMDKRINKELIWNALMMALLCIQIEAVNTSRQSVFQYIEGYYNQKRLHSAIDYSTPNEVECVG